MFRIFSYTKVKPEQRKFHVKPRIPKNKHLVHPCTPQQGATSFENSGTHKGVLYVHPVGKHMDLGRLAGFQASSPARRSAT